MEDDIGAVLKALRKARGMTLRVLAHNANVSHSHLQNIEAGRRPLTTQMARACDRALGTPILTMLATEGDEMRRRALLAHLGALGALGTAAPAGLAEMVRLGLVDAATEQPADWDAIADDYGHRLVSDPSAVYGSSLLADLMLIQRRIREGRPSLDLFRAGAHLAQLYGLWLGNQGDLGMAHRWYAGAIALADSSRDTATRTWARGRSLARGIYEGYTVAATVSGVNEVLALTSKPTPGAMEAFAAEVHVHALTGDAKAGRKAVAGMRSVVDRLPEDTLDTLAGPVERAIFLNAFLECRVGGLADAEAACAQALPALEDWPLWQAETNVYLARARAAHGDVAAGISHALATVKGLQHDVRVIGVAVRDVMSVVPAGYRSDELRALAGYAHTGPVPWETLR